MRHGKDLWIRRAGASLLASFFMLPFGLAAYGAEPEPPTPEDGFSRENIVLPEWDASEKISLVKWANKNCTVEIIPTRDNTPLYYHSQLLPDDKGLKTWLGTSESFMRSWELNHKVISKEKFASQFIPGADNATGVCIRVDQSSAFEIRGSLAFPVAIPVYFGANFESDLSSDSFRKKYPDSRVEIVAKRYAAYPESQRDSVLFLKQNIFRELGTKNLEKNMEQAIKLSHLNEFPVVKSGDEYVAAMFFTAPGVYTLDVDAYLLADGDATTAMAKNTMRYTFVAGKSIRKSDLKTSETSNNDLLPAPEVIPLVVPPNAETEHETKPTEVPTEKPAEVPSEPAEKPTEVPTEVPTGVPGGHEQPTETPTEVPTVPSDHEQPIEQPNGPVETPTEEPEIPLVPHDKPVEQPVEKPVEKPTEVPTEVPSEPGTNPTEQPTETPTGKDEPYIPLVDPGNTIDGQSDGQPEITPETTPETKSEPTTGTTTETGTETESKPETKPEITPETRPVIESQRALHTQTQKPVTPVTEQTAPVVGDPLYLIEQLEEITHVRLGIPGTLASTNTKNIPAPNHVEPAKPNVPVINDSYPAQPDVIPNFNTNKNRPTELGLAWETQTSQIVLISGITCAAVGGAAVAYFALGGKLFTIKLR